MTFLEKIFADPHGGYVIAAYLAAFGIIGGLCVAIYLQRRRTRAAAEKMRQDS